MFKPGTFFAHTEFIRFLEQVSYVELDSVLRHWPRLLRGMRTRLNVPALHRVRPPVAGLGRIPHVGTRAQELIGRR